MKDFKKLMKVYALKNAIHHEGKAQQGAIISGLFAEGLKKEDVKKYIKEISKVVDEVNALSLEKQKSEFEKVKDLVSERETREGLQELPLTDKQKKSGIVMRIAPSASGPMHLFHGINASFSFDYVLKYGGKFYVRVEDTNPENVFADSYELLKEDAKWLTKGKAKFVVQSDRMDLYYKYAEKLIAKNAAYVCTCSAEDFRELAKKKKPCPCRDLSVKENKLRWKKMFKKFKQGEAILRFKTPEDVGGFEHKNPAMRDFPLARINETKHPRQGKKFRVWPLMNLSVSVDDIEMKMTHIIRGKDHRDNALRQEMIFKVLGKKYPWTGFLGRYHFKDLEISTTKFRKGIESGKYKGWDDEKLPTLISLRKQGYKPEAFWKMAEHIGLSEVDKTLDKKEFFRLLDEFNKA